MRSPPLLLVGLLLALSVAALIALAVWQLGRSFEKGDLETERDARIATTPLALDGSATARSPEEIDYRRVAVTGRWDHERALTVGGRIRFGLRGEEVVEPLLPDGGGAAILVNRGWYPLTERERVLADLTQTPRATVAGLARAAAGSSASETRPGVWTRYDVRAMARSLPYAVEPWGLIEGELLEAPLRVPPRELPVQGYLAYENAVPHREYAATWFGLALALTATAYFRLFRRRGGA